MVMAYVGFDVDGSFYVKPKLESPADKVKRLEGELEAVRKLAAEEAAKKTPARRWAEGSIISEADDGWVRIGTANFKPYSYDSLRLAVNALEEKFKCAIADAKAEEREACAKDADRLFSHFGPHILPVYKSPVGTAIRNRPLRPTP